MKTQPLDRAILDLLVEDSYPLWEIAAVLHARGFSSALEDAKTTARERIREMIQRRFIVMYRVGDNGDEIELARDSAVRALVDAANWDLPARSADELRVLATKRGEQAYYSE